MPIAPHSFLPGPPADRQIPHRGKGKDTSH
jgi:hypothetical protein